jgi:hypothetical protein
MAGLQQAARVVVLEVRDAREERDERVHAAGRRHPPQQLGDLLGGKG